MIETASCCRLVARKGHDRALVTSIPSEGGAVLVAVADGLTTESGADAADWAVRTLKLIATQPREEELSARLLFDDLTSRLAADAGSLLFAQSHTTLTCGIAKETTCGQRRQVVFDFFCIGDSPIWKAAPCATGDISFQAHAVYSAPFPGEQGRVYSTLDLRNGCIVGRPYFGLVTIESDEALMLASDGIPENRIFWDDQDPARNQGSPKLVEQILRGHPLTDSILASAMAEYDKRNLLIDDDATLVVLKLSHFGVDVNPYAEKTNDSTVLPSVPQPLNPIDNFAVPVPDAHSSQVRLVAIDAPPQV